MSPGVLASFSIIWSVTTACALAAARPSAMSAGKSFRFMECLLRV
jgi:hypothetical protein